MYQHESDGHTAVEKRRAPSSGTAQQPGSAGSRVVGRTVEPGMIAQHTTQNDFSCIRPRSTFLAAWIVQNTPFA